MRGEVVRHLRPGRLRAADRPVDAGARRAVGVRPWFAAAVWRDGVGAFLVLVPVAIAVYLASWVGWFRSDQGWDRDWGATHPSAVSALSSPTRCEPVALPPAAYTFHVGLDSPHPYSANPWSWLVQGRPTSFFYESKANGVEGCTVDNCSKAITSLGTPVLWWVGLIALAVLLFRWPSPATGGRGRSSPVRGRVPAVVPVPAPDDLHLLRRRLRPVRRARGGVPAGAGTGTRPEHSRAEGGVSVESALLRRRVGAAIAGDDRRAVRGVLRILLADLHRAGDLVRGLGAPDVAAELDLTGRGPGLSVTHCSHVRCARDPPYRR